MASFLKTVPAPKSLPSTKKEIKLILITIDQSLFWLVSLKFLNVLFTIDFWLFWKNNVIHKTQYGFQKHTSTTHAVLDVVSTAYENISQNLYSGLIFLDLRKALYCVPHDILLAKLKYYGIRGPPNRLKRSFLIDHSTQELTHRLENNVSQIWSCTRVNSRTVTIFTLYQRSSKLSLQPSKIIRWWYVLYLEQFHHTMLKNQMNQDLQKVSHWCILTPPNPIIL